ncbi:MAG: glycosyltransferase [Fuerstiella sp.]
MLQVVNNPMTNQSLGHADQTQHVLTVNVEDYFQVGVFRKFISMDKWTRFDSRLEANLNQVLEMLEQHQSTATFFVLGWTAERHPELIRRIADAGHEVASRGHLHHRLDRLPRQQIREELLRSRSILSEVTGQEIRGFRLADGWLSKATLWMLEEIADAGYQYDSSLMPKQADFASEPEWRKIQTVQTASGPLIEVPLTTLPVPGGWLPVAGGNYQRQLPDFLMKRLVERALAAENDPFVMYFQVWELDEEQPRLSMADRLTRLRHYRKLGKYRRILPEYLKKYSFCSVKDHAASVGSPLADLTVRDSSPASLIHRSTQSEVHSAQVSQLAEENKTAVDLQKTNITTPVSIVIPCFNEETSVGYLSNTLTTVRQKLAANWQPQIIFVDDGSRDRTCELLNQMFADDDAVQVLRHDVNQGVSAAILTGINHANTDIVCSMDCDCSYDPHELDQMLPLLTEGVSMVTASPYHKDGLVRNVPGWRLFLSRGLSAIYVRLLKQNLATWTSCFRVYRRQHIVELPLKEKGFLGTAELAASLVMNKRKIVEYPTTLEVRLFGLSKMKTIRVICQHLGLLYRIATRRMKGQGSSNSTSQTQHDLPT